MFQSNIGEFLGENTNLVEIYCTQQRGNTNTIDICLDHIYIENIKSKFKNWKTSKHIAYHRNHLIYLYDLTDDNQVVYTKILSQNKFMPKCYVSSYCYSKLPIYLFPCTKDINYVNEYAISECKISNRVSLIIKEDNYGKYLYIEYKHSPNVDLEKINSTIQQIMDKII